MTRDRSPAPPAMSPSFLKAGIAIVALVPKSARKEHGHVT